MWKIMKLLLSSESSQMLEFSIIKVVWYFPSPHLIPSLLFVEKVVMQRVSNSRVWDRLGFSQSGSVRVRFLSYSKVGFGFYPVGFWVLYGFQIYSRKRPILGKNLKVFRLLKTWKNFLTYNKQFSWKNGFSVIWK